MEKRDANLHFFCVVLRGIFNAYFNGFCVYIVVHFPDFLVSIVVFFFFKSRANGTVPSFFAVFSSFFCEIFRKKMKKIQQRPEM